MKEKSCINCKEKDLCLLYIKIKITLQEAKEIGYKIRSCVKVKIDCNMFEGIEKILS